ncbi:hypothetical protein [Nonomuraea sp. CA-141351]|uniref:hypothetical protein n=1 Tax=Nonomuraea sp. CA-141351 TaxID=3239996 RepID=UPI003D941809
MLEGLVLGAGPVTRGRLPVESPGRPLLDAERVPRGRVPVESPGRPLLDAERVPRGRVPVESPVPRGAGAQRWAGAQEVPVLTERLMLRGRMGAR